ncbi:MAG TPA: hypothetical protein VGW39_00250 [Chthoniobacterales bacterium]|nr:hypothetical protein [Chthoniobacterales bacterium]
MKKIIVAVAAFALLGVLVPQAEAGRRHHRYNRSHHVSYHHGYHRVVHHHYRYRRAYYRPCYSSYYDPYYYFPAPVIRFSFGGGYHHWRR